VLIDRRALSLAVPAAALFACLAVVPAAAKDTGLIFVSNEKSNNLIVIDPKTYKVIKDIKVSRRPRDMHFSADRSKLYVACGDDDVIDILDVAKLEVIGRIPTGPSPETFAIDEAKRRIYVANEEGSSLSIIDMDQNITVFEVPTGAEPEGVLVSEDGGTVYVTSEVGDLIHAIDAEGGYVTQDVVVGTRPRRFAATPDRKELWVTTELSGEVYVIDREKFTVTGKIEFLPPGMRKTDVTPVGLTMTKNGKTAYVTLGHAPHVAVVDVATRNVRVRATVPNADGRLRAGMFANVELLSPEKRSVLVIPATAVLYAPYGDSVFALEEKRDPAGNPTLIAHQKFVRLGERRGDLVAVVNGLAAGETIVSSGAFKLRNGSPVVVRNELAPKAEVNPQPVDK